MFADFKYMFVFSDKVLKSWAGVKTVVITRFQTFNAGEEAFAHILASEDVGSNIEFIQSDFVLLGCSYRGHERPWISIKNIREFFITFSVFGDRKSPLKVLEDCSGLFELKFSCNYFLILVIMVT